MWSMFNETKGKEMTNDDKETEVLVKVIIGAIVVTWIFAAIGVAALLSYIWG